MQRHFPLIFRSCLSHSTPFAQGAVNLVAHRVAQNISHYPEGVHMAKLKVLAFVVYVFLGLRSGWAEAGQVRMRAREHYETMKITNNTGSASYVGFTNTINVWYEDPYRWS